MILRTLCSTLSVPFTYHYPQMAQNFNKKSTVRSIIFLYRLDVKNGEFIHTSPSFLIPLGWLGSAGWRKWKNNHLVRDALNYIIRPV